MDMKNKENDINNAKLYAEDLNRLLENYNSLQNSLEKVYESIAENWQGHTASNLINSLENSRSGAQAIRSELEDAVHLMNEYTTRIQNTVSKPMDQGGDSDGVIHNAISKFSDGGV